MAQLEIRDGQARTIVELSREPLPVGFDAEGRPAWGRGSVARLVGEVLGDRLRHGDEERRLPPGEAVEVDGLELVYRAAPDADRHAAALNEIGNLLWSGDGADALLDQVLDTLVSVLGIERAAIALLSDDDLLEVSRVRGVGLEPSPTITNAVMDSGAAILTSQSAVNDDTDDSVSIDTLSVLCTPLRHGGRAQGVLYLDNHGRDGAFDHGDLDFASALAHLASFALAHTDLREENIRLRQRLGLSDNVDLPSASMAEVYRRLEKVAGFDTTVLITGESGVGKEVIAREIHERSRRPGPFIAVNCAAIPETLLESELLGYAPQSGISGADPKGRAGKIEQAEGGTIFLDEIGELAEPLQAKLLRVLQDKKVDRLNDTKSRDIDVRIVVATNQDLKRLVSEGRFREDLYYRLDVVAIEVPPLRRRRDDIGLLAEFFVRTYRGPEELRRVKLSQAALRAMTAYDWPGNVRELRNVIEQALILGDAKVIRRKDLPPRLHGTTDNPDGIPPLVDVEREHIARVLKATGWNKARSARILGISKPTLYEKIRNYGLSGA
ncbi:MAG: sigma 54-interacting transcriptional regulator [Planctomycetota bacterium]|jgi:transcriptional regulator with GAF, ATPase, and Fis domain